MPIKTGCYFIINVQTHNRAYLPNSNSAEAVQSRYKQNNPGEQWKIVYHDNGHHTIMNIGHKQYAASGIRSAEGEEVKGWERDQTWLIQRASDSESDKGQYIISTTDTKNLWGLADSEQGTPITLANVPTNRHNWWMFKDVETGKDAEIDLDFNNGRTSAGDTIFRTVSFGLALPHVPCSKPFDLDLLVIQEMMNLTFIRNTTKAANRICNNCFTPRAGEPPVVILRLQVLGCTNLLAGDFWGTSDPYVVVSLLDICHKTPVVNRTLNPIYAAKDATFDFPIYLSFADRLDVINFIVWDHDTLSRNDYLGEVALPLEGWFSDRYFPFDHPKNMPFTLDIVSKRAGTPSAGKIKIKLGFSPTSPKNRMEFDEIYGELVKWCWPSLISAPPAMLFWLINSREIILNPGLVKVIKSAFFSTPTVLSYKFEAHYKSLHPTRLEPELSNSLVALSATGLYAELHAWKCSIERNSEKLDGHTFKAIFDEHLIYLERIKTTKPID